MISASWSFPTAVRIAAGCVAELAATCEHHGIRRPLIVTDPGFAKLLAFDAVQASFERPVPVFSAIRPNPVGANVGDGVEAFRSGGHDGVIAVGGGSALDSGKLIAFQAGQTRPLWDFEDIGDRWTRADAESIAPVIAVPTTAGTGSEVGRAGVVIDEDTHRKVIVFHPKMMPVAVLCDPELTVGPASGAHRRHRDGRARALARSTVRAELPPDGTRHRARRLPTRAGAPSPRWRATPATSRAGRR